RNNDELSAPPQQHVQGARPAVSAIGGSEGDYLVPTREPFLHGMLEHRAAWSGAAALAVDDAHAAEARALSDKASQCLLRFETVQTVQVQFRLDAVAAASEVAQHARRNLGAAEFDLAARLLDKLAVQAFVHDGESRGAGVARPCGGPRNHGHDTVFGLQRLDAEHRSAKRRLLILAAVHRPLTPIRSLGQTPEASSIVAPFVAIPGNGVCAFWCPTTTVIWREASERSPKASRISRRSPSSRPSVITAAPATR